MNSKAEKILGNSKFDLKNILIILLFAVFSATMIRTSLVKLFPEDDGVFTNRQRIIFNDKENETSENSETAFEIAGNFCLGEGYSLGQYLFLNADEDEENEVAGVCWKGDDSNKEGVLFVLDRGKEEYTVVIEKESPIESQRYYNFENLSIMDVDEDGIDEVIYGERGWWISGSNSYLYLYSFRYREWFYRVDQRRIEVVDDEVITNKQVEYSDNLKEEAYLKVKNFLENHYMAEDKSGIVEIDNNLENVIAADS